MPRREPRGPRTPQRGKIFCWLVASSPHSHPRTCHGWHSHQGQKKASSTHLVPVRVRGWVGGWVGECGVGLALGACVSDHRHPLFSSLSLWPQRPRGARGEGGSRGWAGWIEAQSVRGHAQGVVGVGGWRGWGWAWVGGEGGELLLCANTKVGGCAARCQPHTLCRALPPGEAWGLREEELTHTPRRNHLCICLDSLTTHTHTPQGEREGGAACVAHSRPPLDLLSRGSTTSVLQQARQQATQPSCPHSLLHEGVVLVAAAAPGLLGVGSSSSPPQPFSSRSSSPPAPPPPPPQQSPGGAHQPLRFSPLCSDTPPPSPCLPSARRPALPPRRPAAAARRRNHNPRPPRPPTPPRRRPLLRPRRPSRRRRKAACLPPLLRTT